MSYSTDLKPAKILNQLPLEDLANRLYLKRDDDTAYYSFKNTDNNTNRYVFTQETANINIKPTIRNVQVINKNKKYNTYDSFVIESQNGSTGIVVVMIKKEDSKNFFCNVRILPLNTLNDIAETNTDSKLLTVNIGNVDVLLKMDITITPSNTGEALYLTHDVNTGNISQFINEDQILQLTKDLEYNGAKISAHFCQEVLDIVLDDNSKTDENSLLEDNYILSLPSGALKKLLTAITTIAEVSQEIVGIDAIKNINKDWQNASAFVGYML
ncbi:hypothetical protein [Pontimicrobium sp. MEBiC06410]